MEPIDLGVSHALLRTERVFSHQFLKGNKMKSRILISLSALTLLAALVSPIRLAAQDNVEGKRAKLVIFDAPGADASAGAGTFASAINPAGMIAGYYVDAIDVLHGFIRAQNGAVTEFDVPGAGPETFVSSINPAGTITGYYEDENVVYHGFVRASDGTITQFDIPGAGTIVFQGTFAIGINPAGAIAGYYVDARFVAHGFLQIPCRKGDNDDARCQHNEDATKR